MEFFQIKTVDHELSTKRWNTQGILSLEPYNTGTQLELVNGTVLNVVEDIEFVLSEINSGKTLLVFNLLKESIDVEFEFI